MTGTALNCQEVGILLQRTIADLVPDKTEFVVLHCRDKQVQHGWLFDHIAGFIVLIVFFQAIVRKVKVCDLDGCA